MAMPFGVSFLPGGDAQYTRERGGQPSGMSPAQQAIQILSMRVPRIVGNNPLAPLALLTGQGGGGLPSGLLERLLQQQIPQPTAPTLPPVPQVPPPQAAVAPPTLPQPVPIPQVPPPLAPQMAPQAAPPVMRAPQLPQPSMARPAAPQLPQPSMARPAAPQPTPRPVPVVTGAPSPNAPPPPQLPQAPDVFKGPKIDFERTGYNPEPGPIPSREDIMQRGDVMTNPGRETGGLEQPSAWAMAQLLRRRMGL